jgi:hypothetical protein
MHIQELAGHLPDTTICLNHLWFVWVRILTFAFHGSKPDILAPYTDNIKQIWMAVSLQVNMPRTSGYLNPVTAAYMKESCSFLFKTTVYIHLDLFTYCMRKQNDWVLLVTLPERKIKTASIFRTKHQTPSAYSNSFSCLVIEAMV